MTDFLGISRAQYVGLAFISALWSLIGVLAYDIVVGVSNFYLTYALAATGFFLAEVTVYVFMEELEQLELNLLG